MSDVDQPLRVANVSLLDDTGTSSSDNSTAQGALSGQIAGLAQHEYVTIEFDRDGDGDVDGTAYSGSEGTFSIDHFTLFSGETDPHGLRTVSVRAVDTGDTPRTSPWTTFSFVYAEDPDSAAAQDLVAVVAALNASSLASEAAYESAVGSAQVTHDQANEAANQNYDVAVGDALYDRNEAVEEARSDYQLAVNAANAAYLTALQSAATAFSIDLGTFGGDSTSFDFEAFTWPTSPKSNRLQLPADSSQPVPPQAGPVYTGPTFNYAATNSYQTAKTQFEFEYAEAKSQAQTTLDNAIRTAVETFNSDKTEATKTYDRTVADATKKYQAQLDDDTDKPADIDEANRDHRDRIQTAWDTYRDAARQLAVTFNGIAAEARATLDSKIEAANQSDTESRQSAYAEWRAVIDQEDVPHETSRAATITYNRKMFETGQTHSLAVADAKELYDSTIHDALMSFRTERVPEWETYQKEVNDSSKELADDIAEFNLWKASRSILAKREFEQARIDAEKVRAKSIADAAWTQDKSFAAARKGNTNSLAQADVDKWQAEVAARQIAFANYASSSSSPWAAYQLALVNIEATYLGNHGAAYLIHTSAVAQATFVEGESTADAAKVRSHSAANSAWQRDNDRLEARAEYWEAPATERHSRALDEADALQGYRNTITTATAEYNLSTTNINGAREGTLMAVEHADDVNNINSRQFKVDDEHYYYGGTWYSGISPAVSAQRVKDRTQLEYDTQSALREASATFTDKQATASHSLRETLRNLRVDELNDIAEAQEAYQHAVATAEKDFAFEYVVAQGVERNALAQASVVFVGSQSGATTVFEKKEALLVKVQAVDEADAQRDFEVEAALEHLNAMDAWNTDNSPWAQLQESLAAAELVRAINAGEANVVYTSTLGNAAQKRREDVADQDESLANFVVLASQIRTGSLVFAEFIFALNLGRGKELYAQALASIAADEAIADRDEASAREAAEDDFEFSQSQTSRAARKVYEEGVQAAALAKYMADTDAQTIYTMSDRGEEAQRVLHEAREQNDETYKESHGEVWEVLRLQQASEIAARIMFYADREQATTLHAADEDQWWDGARGSAEKDYAEVIRETAITLATDVANADNVYASLTVSANNSYDNTLVTLNSVYDAAAKSADQTRTRALDGINSAQREGEVAARGDYNTSLYVQHAADLLVEWTTSATPLAAFQYAVAQLDANLSGTLAGIRNDYQESLSVVSADYTEDIITAEFDLTNATRSANVGLEIAVNNAQATLSLATSTADSTLYVSSITAEALHAEQQVIVRVDYDDLKREALNELNEGIATSSSGYAAEAAAAQKKYYLKVTENVEFGGPGYGWGWGGYYGYGYGGYGYGYYGNWWWGNGGYHYGRWEMDPENATSNNYGWGWGGWGYGGYGWGWGGYYTNWSYDAAAFEELQDDLEDASANRYETVNGPLTDYVTKIGDAQIQRATDLGKANIDLATARGEAAVIYRNAIQAAELTAANSQRNASNTARSTINAAQQAYSNAIAVARIDQVTDEETLNIALKLAEGGEAIIFAQGLAANEAAFHRAAAQQEAGRFAAAALSDNTPEASFKALEASVKADWIDNLSTAYVTRETAKVAADATQAHSLAIGWGERNLARATALANQSKLVTGIEITRSNSVATRSNTYASTTLTAEHSRNSQNLTHRNKLEVDIATAQQEKAVDYAEAEQKYQLARLEQVQENIGDNHYWYGSSWYGGYWGGGLFNYNYAGYGYDEEAADDRLLDLAEADLTYITTVEDSKLKFQKDEAESRKYYSDAVAVAESVRALGASLATHTAALDIADKQAAVEAAFASSEESYWTAETNAANTERASNALADVGFWTAQETAHVTAADAIDKGVDNPWSAFLEAKANGHATWWSSVTDDYLAMIADRNEVESDWQAATNLSHALQEQTIRNAKQEGAVAEANSAKTRDDALANVRVGQILLLLAPAEKYLETVATAQHDRAIEVSLAHRDYAENEDTAARDEALNDAYAKEQNKSQQARRTYQAVEASTMASRLVTESGATSSHTSRVAYISSELRKSDAEAVHDHQQNDSELYVAVETALAGIDKAYWAFEADSLAAMASDLASTLPSPWSAQYAAAQASYQTWVDNASAAQETKRVNQATEQAQAESRVYSEERDLQVTAATADYERARTNANNLHGVVIAQAEALLAQGSSGQYSGTLPVLVNLSDLPTYAVATEGPASYYVGSPGHWGWGFPYSSYGYFGYGSIGYWPGAYNVFGSYGGFGYGSYNYYGYSYFGDYDYNYYGYSSYGWSFWGWNWSISSEPAEQYLSYEFWDLETLIAENDFFSRPAELATDQKLLVLPSAKIAQSTPQIGATNSSEEVLKVTSTSIGRALDALGSDLAPYWTSHVAVTRSALPVRMPAEEIVSASSLSTASMTTNTDFTSHAADKHWIQLVADASSMDVAAQIHLIAHGETVDATSSILPPQLRFKASEFLSKKDILQDLSQPKSKNEKSKNNPSARDVDLAKLGAQLEGIMRQGGGTRQSGPSFAIPYHRHDGTIINGLDPWTEYERPDDEGARIDAKLTLDEFAKRTMKGRLERELANLKGTGGSSQRIAEIVDELHKVYRNAKAIHPTGIGIIKHAGGTIRINRNTPEYKVIGLVGANYYPGTRFYREVFTPDLSDPGLGGAGGQFKEIPISRREFYEMSEYELMSEYLEILANNKFERNAEEYVLDYMQTGVDVLGLIPVIGDTLDAINGAVYLLRGKPLDAALSAVAVIPIAGSGATLGKAARQYAKYADEIAGQIRVLKEMSEQAGKSGKVVTRSGELATQLGKLEKAVEELKDAAKQYDAGPAKLLAAQPDLPVTEFYNAGSKWVLDVKNLPPGKLDEITTLVRELMADFKAKNYDFKKRNLLFDESGNKVNGKFNYKVEKLSDGTVVSKVWIDLQAPTGKIPGASYGTVLEELIHYRQMTEEISKWTQKFNRPPTPQELSQILEVRKSTNVFEDDVQIIMNYLGFTRA
ncbi:hypothetical protein NA78x_000463 [Anatilimnocola sp. NA78]|uniref:hypothetical protein n=1 Tax=Anatilimnocola sp. NA78 TaxID=3415683 RepID=UPI003CE51CCB